MLVALIVLVVGGCNKSTRLRVVLISDRPRPVGEARSCSLDGEWNEMHCFPPENLPTKKYKYMVNAYFDKLVTYV